MSEIAERYHRRADAVERKIAAVRPEQWANPTPCTEWDARAVVGHMVDMHGAMLRPLGRRLSPAPSVQEDPLAAFQAARADVAAVLDDPELSATESTTPTGPMRTEVHIDAVVSDDLVMHGWDLARATEQDDAMDPHDVESLWASAMSIPADVMQKLRTPGGIAPGVVVYGAEVKVEEDAPLQDRLLGYIGRDPHWKSA